MTFGTTRLLWGLSQGSQHGRPDSDHGECIRGLHAACTTAVRLQALAIAHAHVLWCKEAAMSLHTATRQACTLWQGIGKRLLIKKQANALRQAQQAEVLQQAGTGGERGKHSTCHILQHLQRHWEGCERHVRLDLVIGHHKSPNWHLGGSKGQPGSRFSQHYLVEVGGYWHQTGRLACTQLHNDTKTVGFPLMLHELSNKQTASASTFPDWISSDVKYATHQRRDNGDWQACMPA